MKIPNLIYSLLVGSFIWLSCKNEQQPTLDYSLNYDSTIRYQGPTADLATITGSPLWPFSYREIIDKMLERGWKLEFDHTIPTAYGPGPRVVQFVTNNQRKVIWIPDYGWTLGQDDRIRHHQEKLFWVLWKAGVKLLVVGGNSGTSDWRTGKDAVKTGDLVFPWSFRTGSWYMGLPGTKYESVWGNPAIRSKEITQPFMGEPFSNRLATLFYNLAGPYEKTGPVRKVHSQDSVRIALIHPESITFESDFDILYWQSMSKLISKQNPNKPSVVTIHGDCINPILARFLGMEMLYYHIISNVAQGLPGKMVLSKTKDKIIYDRSFGNMALDLEMQFFEKVEIRDYSD